MKAAVVLSGLLVAFAISAQAIPPIAVTSVAVSGNTTNADGSNVTVVANIANFTGVAHVWMEVKSVINGDPFSDNSALFGMQTIPEAITAVAGSCTWTNTSWNPYFTGEFQVTVRVTTNVSAWSVWTVDAACVTNATVARTISGTMNNVQVPVDTNAAYNASMAFTNIIRWHVFLQDNGSMPTNGALSIPCNLVNNWIVTTNGMTAEQIDMAINDIAIQHPVGTPFRFDMNLHKRPDSMMGMGEIKRFVWTPADAATPNGPGRLVLDVISCSPWRNNYETNMQSSVGFAPLFMTNADVAADMKGMIMSATAHYMDASPEVSDIGMGLKVNGRSNTTSYLKAFIPDTLLATWGIPVARASEMLAGYVTHFNANNVSEGDTTAVATDFTRVVGGTNIVYAYNSGTSGDSGYEALFTFTFHSPVAAQIGLNARMVLTGDFDGDGKADPVVVAPDGVWTIWWSTAQYAHTHTSPLYVAGGVPVAGDFDGDRLADPAMVAPDGVWTIWWSTAQYAHSHTSPLYVEGGVPVAGDFDGDRLADPVMVAPNGVWTIWWSTAQYASSRTSPLYVAGGMPLAGDFDGDRLADPAVVAPNGVWTIWWSTAQYASGRTSPLYVAGGVPVTSDFDGDRLADPVMVAPNGIWKIWWSTAQYTPSSTSPLIP